MENQVIWESVYQVIREMGIRKAPDFPIN